MQRLQTTSLILLALFVAFPASAATIDSTYKYAWSDVGGYVNFKPSQGGVSVSDSALTGYAWAANTGWISFDTTQSGVTNDGQGTLGGFAWSEGEGWLSFTGVTIDSNGKFHGTATGADSTLTFDCTNCDVRTDWRVASVGSSGGSSGRSVIQTTSTTDTSTTPPSTPGTSYTPPGGEGQGTNGSTTEPSTYTPNVEQIAPTPTMETPESEPVPSTFPWPLVAGISGLFFLLLLLLFRFLFRLRS